ncbi:uncharacterized protein LOC142104522 isoform X3 [Mixophyes fleayi]|uniref:uncharacterized protein LOC142104522 isoform X3 n=1 Tax=Mixophyes fleayi TaxID=3061075 RepID=UPI003F4D9085
MGCAVSCLSRRQKYGREEEQKTARTPSFQKTTDNAPRRSQIEHQEVYADQCNRCLSSPVMCRYHDRAVQSHQIKEADVYSLVVARERISIPKAHT